MKFSKVLPLSLILLSVGAYVSALYAQTLPTSFSWTSTGPLISPKNDSTHNMIAVKDPSTVRYNGQYVVYASSVNSAGNYGMEYLHFTDWSTAGAATPYFMDSNSNIGSGYHTAPQVFYFAPQNKWYLIFQSGQPQYSTNSDPTQPQNWTRPTNFFSSQPSSVSNWIDFWIISDSSNVYLFFCGDNGNFYRSSTSLANFPNGFNTPVIVYTDSQFALFEADNVYTVENTGTYLANIECIGSDGHRFFRALSATTLGGTWTPLGNTASLNTPFLGAHNVTFQSGVSSWTDDFSSGGAVIDGNDSTDSINLNNLTFLYQGDNPNNGASSYNLIPWQLGLVSSKANTASSPTATPTKTNTPLPPTATFTSTPCAPTAITPFNQLNGGTWTQAASVTVSSLPATVNLGPQPLTGGSWSWTGPNGFASTSREIDAIPLSVGTNSFTATYTNACGQKSTETFTITVTAPTATPTSTPVPPTATFTFTATHTNTPVPPTATFTFTATHTNTPVPPTATPTSTATHTNTPVPPTATNTAVPPTSTNTPVPPTPTFTSVPPTMTFTSVPPTPKLTPANTATSTVTNTPVPPTLTTTPMPPTATNTAVPPTATHSFTATAVPPTATNTPVPPTATSTHTPVPPTPTDTAVVSSASFKVELLSAVTSTNTNSPHPQLEVVNTGNGPLNLNTVTLRYWFNCDCTNQTVQAWVDWAGLMPQGSTETGNVQVSVQPTSLGGQTDYVLYGFTGNMVLQPGQAIQIQGRFNKSDWNNMSQSNDWSFQPYTSYTSATDVTGYVNGALVWGQQPAGSSAALVVSSAMTFPNPSTGNGTTLSFTLGGNTGGTKASVDSNNPSMVDPNAKITLGIYTLSMRLIWTETLTGGAYGSTGQHDLYWNEKDLKGAGLANGLYLLKVTVTSNGQTSSTIAKILILG